MKRRDFLKGFGFTALAAVSPKVDQPTKTPERYYSGSHDDIALIKEGLCDLVDGEVNVYTPTPNRAGLQRLCVNWCGDGAFGAMIEYETNNPPTLGEIIARFRTKIPDAKPMIYKIDTTPTSDNDYSRYKMGRGFKALLRKGKVK